MHCVLRKRGCVSTFAGQQKHLNPLHRHSWRRPLLCVHMANPNGQKKELPGTAIDIGAETDCSFNGERLAFSCRTVTNTTRNRPARHSETNMIDRGINEISSAAICLGLITTQNKSGLFISRSHSVTSFDSNYAWPASRLLEFQFYDFMI